MPNQTMVYSCSAPEQEYTMAWPGILLHLLISSLKIRFCEQSVFAKSPLSHPGEACPQVPLRPGNQRPGRAGFLQDGVAAQQTEAQSVWGECPDADVLEGQPGVVMDVYLR